MPRETAFERRRRIAINSGLTILDSDFRAMCNKKPHRVGIVAEGDSWFAYPRKWLAFGADVNIVHHIADKIEHTDTVNMLRLASNGDEAVGMTTGKQKDRLYKILKKSSEHIDIVLFSGGGNDIVGKRDMLPLLRDYQNGMSHLQCVNKERFERKLDEIMLAYRRLVEMCQDVVPNAKVITHTYDIPQPADQGAEFFWGLIKTKPWVYPYLVRREIPEDLHYPVIEHMLGSFGKRLLAFSKEAAVRKHINVTETQGTLRPGHKSDWLNEIHPSEAGFKRITKKIYQEMRETEPGLPSWN